MHVIIDLCVVPIGVGLSVSKYVAACHEIINKAGLKSELHAYGTNIEIYLSLFADYETNYD